MSDDTEQVKAATNLRSLISETCKLDSSGRGGHENKHSSESGTCLHVERDCGIVTTAMQVDR